MGMFECWNSDWKPLTLKLSAGNGKVYLSKYVLTLEYEKGSSSEVQAIAKKTPTSVLELFTYRGSVTLMTVLLMYTWFVHGASYYGLTIAASNDGGGKGTDLYMSTAIRDESSLLTLLNLSIIFELHVFCRFALNLN